MRKPFNLPSISELAVAHHNDMIRYTEEREELLTIIPTLDGLHKKITLNQCLEHIQEKKS